MELVDVAAEIARLHPATELPCPVCGNTMVGKRLVEHLTRKHADASVPIELGRTPFVGRDRRLRAWIVLPFLAAVPAAAYFMQSPEGEPATIEAGGVVAIGVMALTLGCAMVARLRGFRSSLTVGADELVLRHSLGLRGRRVALPTTWLRGEVWTQGPHDPDRAFGTGDRDNKRRLGSYVAFGVRRRIHVGFASKGNLRAAGDRQFRKSWDGGGTGKRRYEQPDVLLAPLPFIHLQYALAERGVLEARRT